MDTNTEMLVLLENRQTLPPSVGCLKRRNVFAHTTTHEYLPLSMHNWNMQEYLDSYLFCADFPPFCVFETQNQSTESNFVVLIAHWNCIFQGASLELTKDLATLIPEKIQVFTKPFYTIVISLFLDTPSIVLPRENAGSGDHVTCNFTSKVTKYPHIPPQDAFSKASSPNGISL